MQTGGEKEWGTYLLVLLFKQKHVLLAISTHCLASKGLLTIFIGNADTTILQDIPEDVKGKTGNWKRVRVSS